MSDEPKPLTEADLRKKFIFPRQHGPHDYFGMRGKAMRYLLLGTIIVGQLTLGLWFKQERLVGAQRQYTFVEKIEKGLKHAPEILAVNVYFTSGGAYGRDAYLPGWNHTNNTVDCIGGGGAGGTPANLTAGGGGGGGLARYTNVGVLAATISVAVAPGGAPGGAGATGGAGGNTELSGWVGAYGGGGGVNNGGGGAGGTYYAGTGYYAGGAGGSVYIDGAGGGGGAAGRYGGGAAGQTGHPSNGGAGGPSGGGAGGAGDTGQQAGNGANGNEWQANVGAGGGGGGHGYYAPGHGGYYGGGGGGGGYAGGTHAGGYGRPGLIAMVYVPLTAPVISSISPNIGPTAGGQAVTIGGSGFYNVTSVNIGGAVLTGISVPHQGAITGTTAAGGAGLYNVNVNVSGGVAAGAGVNLYTYANPPAASSCVPNIGLTLGNTAITINGTNMGSVTSVTVGGVAATSVVAAAGSVTCRTPAHAAGLVNIVVSGGYGSSTLTNGFTYLLPASGFNMPMLGF
jgi:IPT/TIG domain